MSDELDFSNFDGIDELDWSDVEDELKKNKDMINDEAAGGGAGGGLGALAAPAAAPVAGGEAISSDKAVDMNFLMGIPLKLTVEIGRTTMLIKNLLNLDIDHIMELNKKLGEPMDVFINKKLVARGEIVIQNEKFGLKLTEIVDESVRLSEISI